MLNFDVSCIFLQHFKQRRKKLKLKCVKLFYTCVTQRDLIRRKMNKKKENNRILQLNRSLTFDILLSKVVDRVRLNR